MTDKDQLVRVNGRNLTLTNLDKILWPNEKISKAEVMKYYADLSEYIIAFLKDRPIMTRRYPHGITEQYFVQKHFPHVPEWVNLFSFKSEHYVLCNDLPTLIWLGNLAAIEINHMLAKSPNVTRHDLVLIDLDPHQPASFEEARVVARGVVTVLEKLELEFLLKTSGADGIHFLIPIERRYSVEKIRKFVYAIGKLIEKANPNLATVSTRADRKKGHVYVDFLQNGLEKTITAPLSIRALPGAPVSYPLTVNQLDNDKLKPENFSVRKAPRKSPALRRMLRLSQLTQDLSLSFAKLGIRT
ncbi:MAG: DNA polymerase domain-containing protein [Candidatus Bathyarchaeia archaeon]